MFTGGITENRITFGLPAYIRQALYDDARDYRISGCRNICGTS